MGGEQVGGLLDWLPRVDYMEECIYAQAIIMVLFGVHYIDNWLLFLYMR